MPDSEYVHIKIADNPAEFIEEYNLQGHNCDGWIYFEIQQGCYGLPQAGILANDLLQSRLLAEGYYKAESTLSPKPSAPQMASHPILSHC